MDNELKRITKRRKNLQAEGVNLAFKNEILKGMIKEIKKENEFMKLDNLILKILTITRNI